MNKNYETEIAVVEPLDKELVAEANRLINFTVAHYGILQEAKGKAIKKRDEPTRDPLDLIILGLSLALKGMKEKVKCAYTDGDEDELTRIDELLFEACWEKFRNKFAKEIDAIEKYGAFVSFDVENAELKNIRDVKGIMIEALVKGHIEDATYPFDPDAPEESFRNAGLAFFTEFCMGQESATATEASK